MVTSPLIALMSDYNEQLHSGKQTARFGGVE